MIRFPRLILQQPVTVWDWRRRYRCGAGCPQPLAAKPDRLPDIAAQQMAARDEQIGKCIGHEQAMRVLFEPAIAYLGKAEHPLDNPDRMFDLGPHFGFGAVLARSTSSTTPR